MYRYVVEIIIPLSLIAPERLQPLTRLHSVVPMPSPFLSSQAIFFLLKFSFSSNLRLIVLIADPIKWWTCCLRVCRRCMPSGKPGRKWREMWNRRLLDFPWTVIFFFFSKAVKVRAMGIYNYYQSTAIGANPTACLAASFFECGMRDCKMRDIYIYSFNATFRVVKYRNYYNVW